MDIDEGPGDTTRSGDTIPHVCVVACGGTIASEPGEDGAAPAKTGDDLVAAVPSVEDHASVSAREVCSQPGFDVRWRDVFATAAAVRDAAEGVGGTAADGDDGAAADGVVVTHGTDTLADTAYALDLLTDLPVPVVVTGAQRRLDEPSSDAPANLTLAVRAAANPRFSAGVHVAFDDELHAARDVVKSHSNALSTMRSPGSGPVATFTRAGSRILREPRRGVAVDPLAGNSAPPTTGSSAVPLANVDPETAADRVPEVPMVHSGTGAGAEPIERALNAGVGGVVVGGTGLGQRHGRARRRDPGGRRIGSRRRRRSSPCRTDGAGVRDARRRGDARSPRRDLRGRSPGRKSADRARPGAGGRPRRGGDTPAVRATVRTG